MSATNDPVAARAEAEFQRGFALHQKGQLAQAQGIYQRVLEMQPAHPDALHLQGVIALQTGNLLQAVELIGRAIAVDPSNAAAYSNRGAALKELKRLDEALASYDRAIELKPDYAEAHNNRGIALQELKRTAEALASYDRALKCMRNYAEAFNNRGLALHELKRPDEALASFDRALKLKPDYAEGHFNRGLALKELGRTDEALASYDRALRIRQGYAEAYCNRGVALQALKRLDQALASYDHALKLKPDYAEACNNRGSALQDLKRLDEALASYDRALQLKPDYAEAYSNRGVVLHELRRLDEALDSFGRALELKPGYAAAYNNRGNVLQDLKRLIEAQDSYENAIEFKPEYAEAHWNLALCRLTLGDYARGWAGNEWRWQSEQIEGQIGKQRKFRQPLWLGAEPLQGKTILLHSEQGLGDTLQFCRYAKLVNDLGARVILEVQGQLVALLTNLAGVAQTVEKGAALPAFDYHCPLLSLPLAFKTELNTIPALTPYIASDPAKLSEWQARLGMRTKPRVGLTWSGRATQKNDHNRSLPLRVLVAGLPSQYQYVSLQKETRAADKATLDARPDILRFDEQLKDFTDTAALCQLMDVVVSVCTSSAHLAGAMGKPVLILLTYAADWRWLQDRDDSPWYPSARLFRQDSIGDWPSAIDKVRTELLRYSFALSGSD